MWVPIVSVPDHCLSFYFAKAFDKVSNRHLLYKLSYYGVKRWMRPETFSKTLEQLQSGSKIGGCASIQLNVTSRV